MENKMVVEEVALTKVFKVEGYIEEAVNKVMTNQINDYFERNGVKEFINEPNFMKVEDKNWFIGTAEVII